MENKNLEHHFLYWTESMSFVPYEFCFIFAWLSLCLSVIPTWSWPRAPMYIRMLGLSDCKSLETFMYFHEKVKTLSVLLYVLWGFSKVIMDLGSLMYKDARSKRLESLKTSNPHFYSRPNGSVCGLGYLIFSFFQNDQGFRLLTRYGC